MTGRAAPFYCPYCGDEDLRPFGYSHGQWRCGACQRVFTLKYDGMAASWSTAAQTGTDEAIEAVEAGALPHGEESQ